MDTEDSKGVRKLRVLYRACKAMHVLSGRHLTGLATGRLNVSSLCP